MTARQWRGRVFIGTSLDGRIAREDGSLEWLTDLPVGGHTVSEPGSHPALMWEEFFPVIDAIVMGRSTYETVAAFDEWPFDGKHAIVMSTRGDIGDERVRTASSVEDACAQLDDVGAREVYVDGGRAIQSFLNAGLIDELTISVAPVLLGGGRPLFDVLGTEVRLTVRGSHASEEGLVRTTDDVVRD